MSNENTTKFWWSPSIIQFYETKLLDAYRKSGVLKPDAIPLPDDLYEKYFGSDAKIPSGKQIGADKNGMPIYIDIPPPTREELEQEAKVKQMLLLKKAEEKVIFYSTFGDLMKDELAAWQKFYLAVKKINPEDPKISFPIQWPDEPKE